MGYWSSSKDGNSFDNDSDLIWGDSPADILDDAIAKIIDVFVDDVGRKPTMQELIAGFKFSTNILPQHYGLVDDRERD